MRGRDEINVDATPPWDEVSPRQTEMEAMLAAARPGEPHALLHQFAGSWSVTASVRMAPDESPEESVSTCEARLILGGRFLQEQVVGDMGGLSYEAILVTGYDNVAEEYNFVWIDNLGTLMVTGTGDWNPQTSSLTVRARFADPATGRPTGLRFVRRLLSPTRYTGEMHVSREGQPEFLAQTLDCTKNER